MSVQVDSLTRADLPGVARVLDSTGLFPAEMLDAMAAPFLGDEAPHHWLVARDEEAVVGFAYCEPERLTDGTFNLLAIAVTAERQGEGIGRAVVRMLETRLRGAGGRILLVETSSLDDYAATRSFYLNDGFVHEATIRDFYMAGEDKLIFWKRL